MTVDAIVVGAGLSGLVAAHELTSKGKRVALVDQENAKNLGGQAFWSFGGLFFVNSPEQRRLRVKDSVDLAWNDWSGSAQFDRLDDEDEWAVKWARAYVEFAAGEKRAYCAEQGMSWLPTVGWAERGDLRADGHGNSVPRFHVTWGTGTGVSEPFARRALEAADKGLLTFHYRHRVDELLISDGAVHGIRGVILAPDDSERGVASNRDVVKDFELKSDVVIVATGGIGHNHEMVRKYWPERMGTPPKTMITGVPKYVDGRMLNISADAGVRLVNRDRMWHYTEGIQNWDPIWPDHAIRILPGPSPMWFDALGRRLPAPYLPGYDTLGTLRYLRATPDIQKYDHSWFIVTQKVIEKEFALSGSEQNPDITGGSKSEFLKGRLLGKGAPAPVQAFVDKGADFVKANNIEDLVGMMNGLTDEALLDPALIRSQLEARDSQVRNGYAKDAQIQGIHNSRSYIGDKIGRTTSPHEYLDPKNGPLIGIKLHILTRKTLGGIQTDLDSRAFDQNKNIIAGLYAAGEAAGFGGGGVHGYNALEGTFLGGCIFSGRNAGRHAARSL